MNNKGYTLLDLLFLGVQFVLFLGAFYSMAGVLQWNKFLSFILAIPAAWITMAVIAFVLSGFLGNKKNQQSD